MTAASWQWAADGRGVLTLPSGRRVRGRGLRHPLPPGPSPEVGLYLLVRRPRPQPWESGWVRWPDFGLPLPPGQARIALQRSWQELARCRVEIACGGGVGRTGAALACLAVLDGVEPVDAITFVRQRYHPHAVETPWQRRFVLSAGRW
ncbi:MAG: protein phosphatase [Mycobacteriaceae bacterium]